MDSNDRLIEIVSDILEEIREMKSEIKVLRTDTNHRFERLENKFDGLERAVDRNTEEIAKLNYRLLNYAYPIWRWPAKLTGCWTWTGA